MRESLSDVAFLEEKIKELTKKKNDPTRRNPKRTLAFEEEIIELTRRKDGVVAVLKGN